LGLFLPVSNIRVAPVLTSKRKKLSYQRERSLKKTKNFHTPHLQIRRHSSGRKGVFLRLDRKKPETPGEQKDLSPPGTLHNGEYEASRPIKSMYLPEILNKLPDPEADPKKPRSCVCQSGFASQWPHFGRTAMFPRILAIEDALPTRGKGGGVFSLSVIPHV